MAQSVIEICNLALDLIGEPPIMNLDTLGDQKSSWCARNYGPARDAVLRSYPWHVARRRVALAASSEAVPFGWTKAFPLPTGPEPAPAWLRTIGVEGMTPNRDYAHENRRILANTTGPINLVYIGRIEDPTLFDPLLDQALAAFLAWRACIRFENASERRKELWGAFSQLVGQARQVDSEETGPEDYTESSWLASRY
jgi:hypothetical protein